MDFAALMSKEISKAKPGAKAEEASKKYMKRSEVEAERREKYLAEQRAIETEKESKLAQKRKREEEEAEANAARRGIAKTERGTRGRRGESPEEEAGLARVD
jgi:pre-mRNA-splicing factor 18